MFFPIKAVALRLAEVGSQVVSLIPLRLNGLNKQGQAKRNANNGVCLLYCKNIAQYYTTIISRKSTKTPLPEKSLQSKGFILAVFSIFVLTNETFFPINISSYLFFFGR